MVNVYAECAKLRIISAQSPWHIAIKAFPSVLTIAMYRCTIITLLLDFNFEVLIFSQLVDNYASFTSRIQVHGKGPRNFNVQPTGEKGCWGEVICHKKVQQSFLNQGLDLPHPPNPPIKNSWIRLCCLHISDFLSPLSTSFWEVNRDQLPTLVPENKVSAWVIEKRVSVNT